MTNEVNNACLTVANAVNNELNWTGIARRVLYLDFLEAGRVPRYDVMDANGNEQKKTITCHDITSSMYPDLSKITKMATIELRKAEDDNFLSQAEECALLNPIIQASGSIGKDDIKKLRDEFVRRGLICSSIVMHNDLHKTLSVYCQGINVYSSQQVPQGTIYGFADPELLGVFCIANDATCHRADGEERGYFVTESIGIEIFNPISVSALKIR